LCQYNNNGQKQLKPNNESGEEAAATCYKSTSPIDKKEPSKRTKYSHIKSSQLLA